MFRLTVDQGNSLTKCTVFSENGVVKHEVFDDSSLTDQLDQILTTFLITSAIISTVRRAPQGLQPIFNRPIKVLLLQTNLNLPFVVDYQTPETLGSDRLANAAGAIKLFEEKNILVVDCGTCITYSLILNKRFVGGAIAPGILLRLKSLKEFTGQLPLVHFDGEWPELIGKSTKNSILAGVVRGIVAETDGMILNYCSQIANLNVIITGGHLSFFEPHLKSTIFAAPLLTPEGLHEILLLNEA